MKKIGYAIIAILIILLGVSAAGGLLYIAVPGFAAAVNERLNIKSKDETNAVSEDAAAKDGDAVEDTSVEEVSESAADAAYEPTIFPEAEQYEGISPDVVSDYTPPSEYDLHIPEELTGFLGLEPFEDTVETVSDEEADRIEAELSTGPVGDELDFDPLYYPYYAMLDDQSRHLYRQIYANANELNPSFRAVEKEVSAKQLYDIFTAVFDDHPELFWLNTAYGAIYRQNGDFLELDLSFNSAADDIKTSRAAFDEAVSRITSEAKGSEYDKEKTVHDVLAEYNEYRRNPLDQSAFSGVVKGETVCSGYSRAFQHIMNQLGIPCYMCEGYAGEAHGWNIICLDGEYYNVDLTWDDADPDEISYNYFNKTDADYGFTHIRRGLSIYLPSCNGEKYRDHDPDEFDDYIMVQDGSGYLVIEN